MWGLELWGRIYLFRKESTLGDVRSDFKYLKGCQIGRGANLFPLSPGGQLLSVGKKNTRDSFWLSTRSILKAARCGQGCFK